MLNRLKYWYFMFLDRSAARHLRHGPTFGEPWALTLEKAGKKGNWELIAGELASIPNDWDGQQWMLAIVVPDLPEPPSWIGAWAQARPDSAFAHLTLGDALMNAAQKARGTGAAKTVTQKGWQSWFERASEADECYEKAAELAPSSPLPWARRITTAIALQEPLETAQQFFDEAVRRDPENFAAHTALLMRLTKKWGGSHDAMFDFARRAAAGARRGSPLHALIPNAHIERALYIQVFEEETGGNQAMYAYWSQPQVQREIITAARNFNPQPRKLSSADIVAANLFAFAFCRTEDPKSAKPFYEMLDRRKMRLPWDYIGIGNAVYEASRREALKA